MKKFSDLKIGDEFFSTCTFSKKELESYLAFSRIKNTIFLYGMDGDVAWESRHARFLKPLHIDEILKIKFVISDKKDVDDEFGMISVDFEGKKESGDVVVVVKKNLYRIKKEPPR
jgi:hypothetical protein